MWHMNVTGSASTKPGKPLWLLAEITYRCPLHCVYCSNPVDYSSYGAELATEDWLRVLREARELGAVQLGFSGGEPLVRDDLPRVSGSPRSGWPRSNRGGSIIYSSASRTARANSTTF